MAAQAQPESVQPRILLVEDDEAIADAVAYALSEQGFEVDVLGDGAAAVRAAVDDYDVVILDVMLPKLSGLEACRQIRERSIVPVVMLTARTGEVDRVLGLEAGADDYVPKPFSMPELISRVRAILRRRSFDRRAAPLTTRTVGALALNLTQQTLSVDGRRVAVTPSDFRLLALLAGEPERAFTRGEIVEHLWRESTRQRGPHMRRAREEPAAQDRARPSRPERLVTVRGVGYMLRAA